MSSDSPLGLIAGAGPAPLHAARALREAGRDIFVMAFKGYATPELEEFPHKRVGMLQLLSMVRDLKARGCREIIIIGAVTRPTPAQLAEAEIPPDLFTHMQDSGLGWGDGALLTHLAHYLEEREGLRLVGVHEVCPDLVARGGLVAGAMPDAQHRADIELAARAARAIGALDAGQAAVAVKGAVLSLEAAEGTAAMLKRTAHLPARFLGTAKSRAGVLVKLPRPAQDLRLDMPAIGVETVELAAAAHLAGIAVEEGRALFLDGAEKLAQAAVAHGLFIFVMPPS